MINSLLTSPDCGESDFLGRNAKRCDSLTTIDGKAELASARDLDSIASEINAGWRETQAQIHKAVERAVYFGSLLLEARHVLPHGQFGPWLQKACPEIPERTTRQWMALAQEAFKLLPQIKDADIPAHQLLIAAPETLTEAQRTLQGDFIALLDGKTQYEILWGFKSPKKHHPIKPALAHPQAEEEALTHTSIETIIGNIMACRLEFNLLHATDDQLLRIEQELISSLEHIRSFTRKPHA